jgi:hypothetical protein
MTALPWGKHEYKFLHNPPEQENQFLKWKKEKSSTKEKRYTTLNVSSVSNSMGQGLSWEADNFSASQEVSHILYNLKGHYHVQKSLPVADILTQIVSAHALPANSIRPTLILSPHMHLHILNILFIFFIFNLISKIKGQLLDQVFMQFEATALIMQQFNIISLLKFKICHSNLCYFDTDTVPPIPLAPSRMYMPCHLQQSFHSPYPINFQSAVSCLQLWHHLEWLRMV